MDAERKILIENARAALARLKAFEAEMSEDKVVTLPPRRVPDALDLKMEALFIAKYGAGNAQDL